MTSLLQMFQSSMNAHTGGVQEDALMAVGTMVEILQKGFTKYMDALKPYLIASLKNVAEYQVIVQSLLSLNCDRELSHYF